MANLSKLVASVSLAFLCVGAHAFVSPSPPPGFGGSPGAWTHTPPSAAQQIGQIMRGPGPMIPGGGASSAAFRLGPGAARALAGGIARGLIPGVGLALGVAWLASNCFEKQNGVWVRTCGPGLPTYPQSTGIEYKTQGWNATDEWFLTYDAACSAATAYLNGVGSNGNTYSTHTCTRQRYSMNLHTPSGTVYQDYQGVPMLERADTCPAGWYKTPAGCMASPPPQVVTPEQIEEEMQPKPLPQQLPPGFPYPLDPEAPSIWEPDTANPPNSQPKRVPQGNPVPIPNTNPQQYRQPVTRWTHSPTQAEPWRMDVRPEEIVGTDPKGLEQPQTVTSGSPSGEKPEQFDLCKEHPDILACQKLDEVEDKQLPEKQVPISVTPDSGWGASNAACPPPRHLTVQGRDIPIPFDLFCQYMAGIRPIIIALAWLSAGFILVGGLKGND